jgi:anaerobic ribonucleoside-triphosphate reductase
MNNNPLSAATASLCAGDRQRCEVWTRVMGYHRPVSSFNIGKQGEHAERRFFAERTDAIAVADAA